MTGRGLRSLIGADTHIIIPGEPAGRQRRLTVPVMNINVNQPEHSDSQIPVRSFHTDNKYREGRLGTLDTDLA